MITELVLAAALAGSAETDLSARMAAAAAAAQALRGPLDGRWTLRDRSGAALYVFEISDPPPGAGATEAAWRGAGDATALGPVDRIRRIGAALDLRFAPSPDAPALTLTLDRDARGQWRGWMRGPGSARAVTLLPDP